MGWNIKFDDFEQIQRKYFCSLNPYAISRIPRVPSSTNTKVPVKKGRYVALPRIYHHIPEFAFHFSTSLNLPYLLQKMLPLVWRNVYVSLYGLCNFFELIPKSIEPSIWLGFDVNYWNWLVKLFTDLYNLWRFLKLCKNQYNLWRKLEFQGKTLCFPLTMNVSKIRTKKRAG